MKKTVKETLKAIGWMFTGAVLLLVGWFAFAQLVLVPRFESSVEGSLNRTRNTAEDFAQSPPRPSPDRFHYTRSMMSYLHIPDAAPAQPDVHAKWRGAALSYDPQSALEHAVTGHRVTAGTGAVLNYQIYSDNVDPPAMTERAVFEKLTIFLPKDIPSDYGLLSLSEAPGIIVFWSRGSPDLEKGQMCSGYAKSGEIDEYRRVSGELQAKLSFEMDAKGTAQPDGKACEPFTFRHATKFRARPVNRLDQWNGGGWGEVTPLDCMPNR